MAICHQGKMRELWTRGYTRSELDLVQARFGLRFPPDLVDLLRDRRPLDGWGWLNDEAGIRRALDHPLSGLLFDVGHGLWWPEWGERPATAAERTEVVTAIVAGASPLIPLIGHRYIPAEPHEPGNPVFSVMQSDVIYYGTDLDDYFRNEFATHRSLRQPLSDFKFIAFWSDLVERNGQFWGD
jgi:hypothetical protein